MNKEQVLYDIFEKALRTSFVVELLEHLADDLPDVLHGLEVVLRLVVLAVQRVQVVAGCAYVEE